MASTTRVRVVWMLGLPVLLACDACSDPQSTGGASSPDGAAQGSGRADGAVIGTGHDAASAPDGATPDPSGTDGTSAGTGRDAASSPAPSCESAGSVARPYGIARPGEPCEPEGYRRCWDNTPHVCTADSGGGLAWQPETECSGERPACMGGCCQAAVVQAHVDYRYACALRSTGQVKCWGDGGARLGLGSIDATWGDRPGEMGDALPAVDLGTGQRATAIAGSLNQMCALLEGGRLKCWGDYSTTQISDEPGEMGDNLPVFDFGPGVRVDAVDVSGIVCAILDSGEVRCWSPWEQKSLFDARAVAAVDLGVGRRAVQVATDSVHHCAILDGGSLKCWGLNRWGQLGLGDVEDRDTPQEMGDNLPEVDLGAGRQAAYASVGHSTCVVLDDGSATCWGLDGRAPIPELPPFYATGELGVEPDGTRGDEPGEMGDSLALLELASAARLIAASDIIPCVVLRDGKVQCWGSGFMTPGDRPGPPIEIGHGRRIVDLAVTTSHACAILDTGQLKCWGIGDGAGLGLGDREDRPVPTEDLPEVDLGEG